MRERVRGRAAGGKRGYMWGTVRERGRWYFLIVIVHLSDLRSRKSKPGKSLCYVVGQACTCTVCRYKLSPSKKL